MADVIRVLIGTEPKAEIARRVLEFSIRRRTTAEIEFTPMIGPRWEYDHSKFKVGTGFSLRRWLIPEYCGWEGKAVYLDADQIVLADIRELWDLAPVAPDGPVIWTTFQTDKMSTKVPWPQTSVMVIDCAQASGHWGFDRAKMLQHLAKLPTKQEYANFMHATWLPAGKVAKLPIPWNHLNHYESDKTKLLHYTKEDQQPWYKPDHPLAHLFQTELELAIKAGEIPKAEFEQALAAWGKKEDWRPKNGINPWYRRYLSLFPS